MDKEELYRRLETAIHSSTKDPKYMSFSTEKLAELLNVKSKQISQTIDELVKEGRLRKSKLETPPKADIYFLPNSGGTQQATPQADGNW